MKKRSTEILQRLLKNPNEKFSLQQLINDYHMSEKTLKNDIWEILDFVDKYKLKSAVSFDNHYLKLNNRQKVRQLMDIIYTMDTYDYKLSLEERKIYIIITLLYHKGYYSMQQLADELFVTRNTIINDCKIVDKYLKKYNVDFIAKSNKGIKIEGNAEQITLLLIGIFLELIPALQNEKTFFVQFILKKMMFIYSLSDIIYHMNCFTKENNIIFAKEIFFEIAICIFVLINRIQQNKNIINKTSDETDFSTLQLDIIGNMVNYIANETGFYSLNKQNIIDIEKIIFLRNLYPQIQSISDFDLYGAICHFLLELSSEMNIDIQTDDLLVKSLISHIKSMDNWNDSDFDISNEYDLFNEFNEIRSIAEDKFYILEKYLKYKLSVKMKDSIIIHICAALLRNRQNITPCNIVVSCPGSMATSKYLEAQIKNYFNFNVVNTMTTKQIEAVGGNLENTDFIISTVPINDSKLPVIVVSPVITIEDINKIQQIAFKKNMYSSVKKLETKKLLSKIFAIYRSEDTAKIMQLNQELSQILQKEMFNKHLKHNKSALLNLLKKKYIKLVDNPLEWKYAMQKAAEDLEADGYFDTKYVNDAIRNVEEYGSYIIVNKGIALAHASNKQADVYEDGIRLLVAKNGIHFEDGEIVYLLFFFAQKGETDYLNLFKEIIKLGKNTDNLQKMQAANNISEIYNLIENILVE